MEKEIFDSITPVIKRFNELGVGYFIGGSVASSSYGVSRSTLDIDVVCNLSKSQIDDFLKELEGKYYISREAVIDAIQNETSFNLISLKTIIKIDVFILKKRAYDQTSFIRRKKGEDGFFWVSEEDVLLNKILWYKLGNELSDRQWSDISGLLKVCKNMDHDYLIFWAKELKVDHLLERARKEVEES